MRRADGTHCDGITLKSRRCKRRPTVSLMTTTAGLVHYCTQHNEGAGVMRMLRPYPWEVVSEVRMLSD